MPRRVHPPDAGALSGHPVPLGTRVDNSEGCFLDIARVHRIMTFLLAKVSGMFLDVKELALHKLRLNQSYAPGAVDYHTRDFRQVDPLEVRATAEMVDTEIHIAGELRTRVEMACARCLEPVVEEVTRDFDLYYRPMQSISREEEVRLKLDDTEVGFFEGDGLFLTDVLAEQVLLAIPMKAICRSDCKGLCPHCGANLNSDECRCEAHLGDPRMAPLARLKQDWFKKQ